MSYRGFFGCCLTVVLFGSAVAQDDGQADKDYIRTIGLDFRHVRLIKPVEGADEPSVQIAWTQRERDQANSGRVTNFRTETRTRMVAVTKMRAEQRTRKVPVTTTKKETRTRTVNVDGKPVEKTYTVEVPVTTQKEQTYTVQVPVIENVQQTYTVQVPYTEQRNGPVNSTPASIKVADLNAWDLSGEPVTVDQLAKRLSKPTAAFLLQRPLRKGFKIERAHLAVLRPDTLLLYTQPESKKAR